jgi:hypothetical protein
MSLEISAMNESTFRSLFHEAIGEIGVPAYLSSQARLALRHADHTAPDIESELGTSAEAGERLALRGFADRHTGHRTERAAGIAAVVLAAIVIGTFVYIRTVAGLHTTPPVVPALPDPGIGKYQAMIAADYSRVIPYVNGECTIVPSTPCADAAAVTIGELQTWVDDLNQTRPPTRFVGISSRMRRDLALATADLQALVAANKAMDENRATTVLAAVFIDRDALYREAGAVINSSQETLNSYSGMVRLDNSNLLACDLCQRFVGQNQVSCGAGQAPSCVDEIAALRLLVETFQDDLVRGFAPNPLAAKDQRLQTDLLAADAALDVIGTAQSAGDSVQVGAGQNALRQALSRVNSDAADIAKGA